MDLGNIIYTGMYYGINNKPESATMLVVPIQIVTMVELS